MDVPAFASFAQLRIILVPVGNIARETFDKWAALIRSVENIRLGDIPVDNRDERARFMPNPLATGHIHISFPSHPPPAMLDALSLIRPSAFPMGVIGVSSCSQEDSLANILAQFNATVNGLFPRDSPYRSMFPLARNCFVFEDGDGGTNLNLGEQLSGLVVIPSMMGNKAIYIGTLLADLCSSILGGFASIVQTLETPVGNEYLNSTLFPVVPTTNDLPAALVNDYRNSLQTNGSHADLNSSSRRNSLQLKRPGSTGPAGPGVTSPSRESFRQSTMMANAPVRKRLGIGAASSHGRLFKVLGDLFLLAGRTEDAVVWYTEAVHLCRGSQDFVWHASALEGMAVVTVADAWTQGHGLNASFSTAKGQWDSIVDKLVQAAALYARAPTTPEGEAQLPLITYLYTSCVMRHSALLLCIWASKGWGPLAFAAMLAPGPFASLPPTLSGPDSISPASLDRLTHITGISRADIATVTCEAHGPWLLHLGPRERVALLEAIAGIYSCLGYKRKEAYVLREVLGCIMDLVVIGREDPAERNRRASISLAKGAGLGIQNVQGVGSGTVGVRENEGKAGNESILRIVKYICRVHGIDLDAVKLLDTAPAEEDSEKEAETEDEATTVPFGWPELQVGIVREALAVAEALPDYPAVGQFSLSALKTLHPLLTAIDQQHLYATAARALATAKRRGDRSTVDYWSGKPISSIEVTPLPFARLPIEKPMSSLSTRSSNPILPKGADPFLYNPRRAVTAKGQMTVVQNENVEVIVTLRNPYVFDLEIQSLVLKTSGVPFEHKPLSCLVPPNSFHPIAITGKVLEPGTLTISGCDVQAPGGLTRTFLLPLTNDEEDEKQIRRRSAVQNEAVRHKYGGLDSRPWELATKRVSVSASGTGTGTGSAGVSMRFLECVVVPEQPLLRIRRTSLTHGAVMLYNGERSTIRLTIENVSNLPVDFVKVTFDDNTIAPAQQALADGELSVFDTYETEYDLIHRPAFSWEGKESTDIKPGDKSTITVSCLGRVGCTSGSIQLSYSYAHRKQDSLAEPPDVFHTRHLVYPVLVTVYHMLECYAMDIMPCPGFEPSRVSNGSSGDSAAQLLDGIEDSVGWCLFSIEVRNTYGLPFDITFERQQEDVPKAVTTGTVAPGSTTRIILPIRKFRLSEAQLEAPIPTLSDRQFVVDKSGMSARDARLQRELFWYREALFAAVRGRWSEAGGARSGELFLRRQRMALPMLETLRTETARVRLALEHLPGDEQADVAGIGAGRFTLQPNHFCALRLQVTNHSYRPLTLSVDVVVEPAEHVIFEGSITGRPLGRVDSGASAELVVPVCFVSSGAFECVADVRTWEDTGRDEWVGSGRLQLHVRD